MEGRSQFLMNLGMTLSIGVYSTGSAFFSELMKGGHEWNGMNLAVEFGALLFFLAITIPCFTKAHSLTKNVRE
jgi:hypothetical protein